MSFDPVVFDCDGTLVNSHASIFEGIKILMEEHLQRDVTLEEVKSKYSADMASVAASFGIDIHDQDLAEKLLKRWQEISQERTESRVTVFEGIFELLEDLKKKGKTILLWTARDRKSTVDILRDLNLEPYFLDIVCADDTKMPKPSPDGLVELGKKYSKKKMILIGDSTADLRGAETFGIPLIAACWNEWADKNEFEKRNDIKKAYGPGECLGFIG